MISRMSGASLIDMPKNNTNQVVLPRHSSPAAAVNLTGVIVVKMTGNTRFPSPPILLSTLQSQAAALAAANTQVRTGARGSAAAERDLADKLLRKSLRRMRDYVQSIVDDDPLSALAIALSAGMLLKRKGKFDKPPLDATPTTFPGEIALDAKAGEGNVFYEWTMSTDRNTWTSLPSTSVSKTTVTGLTAGVRYYFRVRISGQNPVDWCEAVWAIAK